MADKKEKLTDPYIKSQLDLIFSETAVYDTSRSVMELSWFRNVLYYLGEQWLSWFAESRQFGRRYSLSGYVPTPVSNIIKDYVRSMKALVLNKRYTTRVFPNSEERADKEAAALGVDVLRWLDSVDDGDIFDTVEWIALWMVLTGNGFARVFAELDDGVYVLGPDGKGIARGEVAVEPILPFNVRTSALGVKLDKKSWVALKSIKPREWVEDTYKVLVPQSDNQSRLVDYEKQLMTLVANVSPWKGRGVQVQDVIDSKLDDLVLYREVEYRPTRDFPKGRYVAMAGDYVVEKRDSMPIPAKGGRWDYTLVHFPYNFTPGSMLATGGVDDLISPQNQINEIDQALVINRKSIGRPWVATPAQVTLKRLSSHGASLMAIEYDGRNAGGGRPIIQQGTPYPQQIQQERDNHKSVAQDAAGDPKNILRGQSPHSGASGIMVDSLREAAEASHGPDIQRFYRNRQKLDRKRLTVAQLLYTETRMIKVPGEGNRVRVRAFKGADLRNNTDVRLELDSSLSSTQVGRNEMMLKMMNVGFFRDDIIPPKMRRELGRRMGMGTLPDDENLHQDKAELENSVFAFGKPDDLKLVALPNSPINTPRGPIVGASGQPVTAFPKTYDPTFRFDNHAVHAKIHLEFILSPEFRSLAKERQQWATAHLDLHQAALEQIDRENTQKMAEKAALGVTEPGQGGSPPAAPTAMQGSMGMMPPEQQMQGQEGGMKPGYGNY